MKAPRDLEDLASCVKYRDDAETVAWCVECEGWKTVCVIGTAEVKLRPKRTPKMMLDLETLTFACDGCDADLSYLIQPHIVLSQVGLD